MTSNGASDPLLPGGDVEANQQEHTEGDGHEDEHIHYSQRANWLRAAVLGANDGLVSVASIMLGVGAASTDQHTLLLSGLSALVAGAMSMAAGEYISVASQKDTEEADVEKERRQQEKGPEAREHELEELAQIYVGRGCPYSLAREVAETLSRTKESAVEAHARDELGIDLEDLANPMQAALASLLAFTVGGIVPLIGGFFISDPRIRLATVSALATVALLTFGATGAWLGGAKRVRAALRVLLGGWLAMGITFGVGYLFGENPGR
ncbi:g9581 [Coccomyxa elongata]